MTESDFHLTDQGHIVGTITDEFEPPQAPTQIVKEIHLVEKQIIQHTEQKRSVVVFIKKLLRL